MKTLYVRGLNSKFWICEVVTIKAHVDELVDAHFNELYFQEVKQKA